MKGEFVSYLNENETLIISGIIEERMDEGIDAVGSAGFTKLDVNIREGWAAVKLVRN